ncbi:PDR/VanB family oxidoreductase (plasmid) [Klebsiella sp. B345]|uniref:PDR/VanB family oxidoreductase n=1 Tax=Klebsiella sp. B345 TaxID=2755398 RepID=UPI003DA8AD77
MSDILTMIVDGLWLQGDRNIAVKLVSAEKKPLPLWQPGAHIDVHLPGGLIRQYSLTGSCEDTNHYLLCVSREVASRGGSQYIHDELRPGQRLMISSPRNLFKLQENSHVLLLAAGIGITPLYAMALSLAKSATPFTLHYYVKRTESAAFISELSQQLSADEFHVHNSNDGSSPRIRLSRDIGLPRPGGQIYYCGPKGFMAQVHESALEVGWDTSQLHSEAFQLNTPACISENDDTFTITLSSTGECWPVPVDRTIAQVLQQHGVAVPLSCEMGICGACLTPVVEGIVDHRDTVQSEADKNAKQQHIAICCSRSHSANLVIDMGR